MIYLLDANVLITAHHLYYPVDAVPEFWEWLAHQGVAGQIKMPVETFEEAKAGGPTAKGEIPFPWVQEIAHKSAIFFTEDLRPNPFQRVAGDRKGKGLTSVHKCALVFHLSA